MNWPKVNHVGAVDPLWQAFFVVGIFFCSFDLGLSVSGRNISRYQIEASFKNLSTSHLSSRVRWR